MTGPLHRGRSLHYKIMHLKPPFGSIYFLILLGAVGQGIAASADLEDAGWPRIFKNGEQQLTVHQPQVDLWAGYTNLQFRCAIGVKTSAQEEKFGVAEV